MEIIKVLSSSKNYDVYIGSSIIEMISELINTDSEKITIITDENVKLYYLDKLMSKFDKDNFYTHVIKAGEKSKSIENMIDIYKELIENKRIYWTFIGYAFMQKYQPVIETKEKMIVPVIDMSSNLTFRKVATWLKNQNKSKEAG